MKPNDPKPRHGGKRANSGRKPKPNKKQIRAFKLTDETVQKLRAIGNGNATRGIEILTSTQSAQK